MDSFDPSVLRNGILFFIIIASSLCIHEWAHAWVADKLGDPTPHNDGRVTLNPLVHIDLIGTIIFPLFCIFVLNGRFFIGWARPVNVNANYFRHPARDDMLVTAAGPLANFILTLLSALVGALAARHVAVAPELAFSVISINAWLFVFNMLPIPPLDGGRILRYFVGMSWDTFARISQWSMFVLIAAFYLVPPFVHVFSFLIGLTSMPAMMIFYNLAGL